MEPDDPPGGVRRWFATHLSLARASNLPTVVSNCLAAWALAGGGLDRPALVYVILATMLIYVGGMYLNDACDAEWDAENKADRPIPQGRIGRRQVYVWACALLACGWALTWLAGWMAGFAGSGLVALVVAYDVLHKRVSWSPILMGGCRAMVYLTAAAAGRGFSVSLLLWAVTIGLYVVALTHVAREEETNRLRRFAPLGLLLLPVVFGLYPAPNPFQIAAVVVYLVWLGHSVFYALRPKHRSLRKAVSGLLAGVCLVDFIAAGIPFWQIFIGLMFLMALAGQRRVAAT